MGNELVPIATIPHEVALYFGLADENLHSGKAYFIDHAANHHPEVTLDEYEKIQEVIEDYDDIKDLSSDKQQKVAFIKKLNKGYAVVAEVSKKEDKLLLHKTFFYKDSKAARVPYKNKPSLKNELPVDGSTTISPIKSNSRQTPNISALGDSTDKGKNNVPTKQGEVDNITKEIENLTFGNKNDDTQGRSADDGTMFSTIDDVQHYASSVGSIAQEFGLRPSAMTNIIGSREELEQYKKFLDEEIYEMVVSAYNDKCTGYTLSGIRLVFIFRENLHDEHEGQITWWHEQTHCAYNNLALQDKAELAQAALDWLEENSPYKYDVIKRYYKKEKQESEGVAVFIEEQIERHGIRNFIESDFADLGELAKLADVIRNAIKYGTEETNKQIEVYHRLRQPSTQPDSRGNWVIENSSNHERRVDGGTNSELKGIRRDASQGAGVLNPKSSEDNAGNYSNASNDIRFSIANRNQVGFVSNAMKAVEGIKQEKATPSQWLAMIQKQGGLKAGEDKWLGLSEWLKGSDAKTLTKDDVLEFIGENMIQIEEVNYTETADSFNELKEEYENLVREEGFDAANEEMTNRYGDDFYIAFEDLGGELTIANEEAAAALLGSDNIINRTRLDYTTEGLDNKREIALTVPTVESWNSNDEVHFGDAGDGRAVAWIRFGETTDSEGDRVLVIDEIQSKRHQEGREKGYKSNTDKFLKDNGIGVVETDTHFEFYKNGEIDKSFAKALLNDIEEAKNIYVAGYEKTAVPSAPFDKNWHELAVKRMLRLAAEEGFDKVAWTTGAQQAKRYDLGKQVDEINVYDTYDGTHQVQGTKDGIQVFSEQTQNGEAGLAELIGREMARKAYSNLHEGKSEYLVNGGYVSLKGDNLIGGEGMKGFYDKMLPSFLNKYGKKWGVKVGEVTLPELEESAQRMWAIDVTPEMKESVGEQTMFSAKRKAPETVSVQDEHHQTVISSADGAKVLKDLDSAITEYENDTHTKEKTFLGSLAKILGATKHGSNSKYATFETMNGNIVTIRLSNHNARVSTFDNHNEQEGISIVVTAQDNNGVDNDGTAHVVEFFYDAIKLRKADGKPLVEILKSIKQALYSGVYRDTTGLAEREEVNTMFSTVYHDSDLKIEDRTMFSFAKTLEEFDIVQREAERQKGIVAPGLNSSNVNVVNVERHDFTGTGNEAIQKARKWANENIVGEHVAKEGTLDEFTYTIDDNSIKKYLSSVSTRKSDNLGVHLSVLKQLLEVINNSIETEIHADYKKTDSRSKENGVEDKNLLIHRFYGCVRLNDELHRVKVTLKERKSEGVKPYSYEVTKIELLSGSSQNGTSWSNALNNSISGAKLLENVEKSYDEGVKILQASKKIVNLHLFSAFAPNLLPQSQRNLA